MKGCVYRKRYVDGCVYHKRYFDVYSLVFRDAVLLQLADDCRAKPSRKHRHTYLYLLRIYVFKRKCRRSRLRCVSSRTTLHMGDMHGGNTRTMPYAGDCILLRRQARDSRPPQCLYSPDSSFVDEWELYETTNRCTFF